VLPAVLTALLIGALMGALLRPFLDEYLTWRLAQEEASRSDDNLVFDELSL
jgi:hypothetical protein